MCHSSAWVSRPFCMKFGSNFVELGGGVDDALG